MTDHLEALAGLVAELGHGVYRPDGPPYSDDEVAIVVGHEPSRPPQLVVITGYAGPESSAWSNYDEPAAQLRVRGTDDERVSRQRAQSLYDALHGLSWARLPGGLFVVSVLAQQSGPIPMGTDANGRHEHAVNVRLEFRNYGR